MVVFDAQQILLLPLAYVLPYLLADSNNVIAAPGHITNQVTDDEFNKFMSLSAPG